MDVGEGDQLLPGKGYWQGDNAKPGRGQAGELHPLREMGGGFGVTGLIGVNEEREGSMRTTFKFERATLNLGRWGEYSFPPVGEGWFDTVYLDDGEFGVAVMCKLLS
jgi:hypothetical protein